KRSVPGVWSPLNATWGVENRTTALRVIPGLDPKATRVEQRTNGADINPYLALAATLASGLYGIERKLPLDQQPVKGTAYELSTKEVPHLPRTLAEATERLKRSLLARELFGEEFVDHYVRTREWEVREYNKAVTDWELKRYFEII
ncbi:MAG: glutamine synthetase, partial [Deltaproteobacteria bacterium]|nr:glutamine synthetase [Deltaproteobacteria bacterium]